MSIHDFFPTVQRFYCYMTSLSVHSQAHWTSCLMRNISHRCGLNIFHNSFDYPPNATLIHFDPVPKHFYRWYGSNYSSFHYLCKLKPIALLKSSSERRCRVLYRMGGGVWGRPGIPPPQQNFPTPPPLCQDFELLTCCGLTQTWGSHIHGHVICQNPILGDLFCPNSLWGNVRGPFGGGGGQIQHNTTQQNSLENDQK